MISVRVKLTSQVTIGFFVAILWDGMRGRAEEAGLEVEALLGSNPPLHWEAWHQIKGWYRAAVNHAPPSAQVTIEQVMTERVELYSYAPPTGVNIPISVELLSVDDLVPTEDKIEWAATRTAMRVHFLHRHVLDTVVILEEGNLPHPRCT